MGVLPLPESQGTPVPGRRDRDGACYGYDAGIVEEVIPKVFGDRRSTRCGALLITVSENWTLYGVKLLTWLPSGYRASGEGLGGVSGGTADA